jgi:hypothetical protein
MADFAGAAGILFSHCVFPSRWNVRKRAEKEALV